MEKKINLPVTNRAALFDWSVITLSFLLSFIFPALGKMFYSPAFPVLMLTAFLLYAAGVWLKNLPLSYRLTTNSEKPRDIPYMIFLFIGHFIILIVLLIFAEPAVRKLLSMPADRSANNKDGGMVVLVDMLIALVVSFLVFSTKKKRKFKRIYNARYLYWREIIADIFLAAGVGIITFIFWEKAIMGIAGGRPVSSLLDVWFLFVLLAFSYLFFYLPLRYLFLLEDHTSNQTWKRFLVIFGFVLIRALFFMFGI